MSELIITLLITNMLSFGGLIVTIVTIRSKKRKANAESKITEFQATADIIAIYKQLGDDLRQHYNGKIEKLEQEIFKLQKDVNEMKALRCKRIECKNRLR